MAKGILPQTRFGRWTVLNETESRQKYRRRYLCKCDCGTVRDVDSEHLYFNRTSSCGCIRKEQLSVRANGMYKTSEYNIWVKMTQRCNNPRDKAYRDYGGRGITVCLEWQASFLAFYRDMGKRPSSKHSIERRDNNDGYSKDNCYWATPYEQTRNKRNNRWLSFNGETLCLADWARKTGLSRNTIQLRIKKGLPLDRALSPELLRKRRCPAR